MSTRIRIFNSVVFWLVVLFLVFSFLISGIRFLIFVPLSEIPPALQTKSAVDFKIRQWQEEKQKSNILVVGSSLPMCALYYSDKVKNETVLNKIKKQNINPLQGYTKADYFSQCLSQKKGSEIRVFNATSAACMMSDTHLMLSKIMKTSPTPEKIILGVGMRDFADNINASFAATPVYQALFDLTYAADPENFDCIVRHAKPDVIKELILDSCLPLYRDHSELALAAEYQMSTRMKKEKAVISKTPNAKPVTLPDTSAHAPVTFKLDSLGYEKRYMPPNYKQMDLESKFLERICVLCQKYNVEIVLINMPVSSSHKSLSSAAMRKKYLDILEAVSTKYGVKYLNFENNLLIPDSDFLDTVHLSPSGANKFIDYLSKETNSIY